MEKAKRLRNILALGLCFAAYCGFVKYTGKGIPCFFRYIFHLRCPGCGITHMLLALAKGDLKGACRSKTIWHKWENCGMLLLVAALVIFGVIRNLSVR